MSKAKSALITSLIEEGADLPVYGTAPSNPIQNDLAAPNYTLGLEYEGKGAGIIQKQHNDLILEGTRNAIYSLSPSVCIALDLLSERLHSREQEGKVEISVAEYAELRGLKDRQQAKAELIEFYRFAAEVTIYWDPKKLYRISFGISKSGDKTFKVKNRKGSLENLLSEEELSEYALKELLPFFHIADTGTPTRTGLKIIFSRFFSDLTLAFPPMLYHRVLARLNLNKFRAAYHIGRYLSELINTQNRKREKPTEEVTVSIRSLLHAANDDIPAEDKVKNYRHRQQIIKPLEKNLNALEEMGTWNYRLGANEGSLPLDPQKAAVLPFAEWKELYVTFHFKGYLEELRRRNRRAVAERSAEAVPVIEAEAAVAAEGEACKK